MTQNKTNKNENLSLQACMSLTSFIDQTLDEPNTYNEALNSEFREDWLKAIQSELNSLEENKTWTITNLPKDKKTIKTKWIFKIKHNDKNEIARFKARLVAKGYDQKVGIDYTKLLHQF